MCCVFLAGYQGGGAVFLGIGGSTTSNTAVALTNCSMTGNAAGLFYVIGVIVSFWFALVCCAWLF